MVYARTLCEITAITKSMTKEYRILKDIRYYGGFTENVKGKPVITGIGKILTPENKISHAIPAIGQRIARKLNENNFISGIFDHVYINFTTTIPEGHINTSTKGYEERILYLDLGICADKIRNMTNNQKEEFIIQSTFRCLEYLYKDNKKKISMIKKVEDEIRKFGPQLEITYLIKETKAYTIKIYYKIKPDSDFSYAFIEYYDNKTDLRKRASIELRLYEDIYFLIDRVSVKEGRIVLSPKTSFTADIHNKRYTTPISIEISKMQVI